MLSRPMLNHFLEDEGLTRGLGDAEARVLVEWLVERAEERATQVSQDEVGAEVARLWRRGRSLSRFVCLWCQPGSQGAAVQLAAVERFPWPFPPADVDPCELMQDVVGWETDLLREQWRGPGGTMRG